MASIEDLARYREIELPFGNVIQEFQQYRRHLVEKARDEFFAAVQPDLERHDASVIDRTMMEWFVFDFRFGSDKTPLSNYLMRNPDKLRLRVIDWMKQARNTQFSSEFWILSADGTTGSIELEDFFSGTRYTVYDESFSRGLVTHFGDSVSVRGQMATRLAQVDGLWLLPGNNLSYMPLNPTQRMKDMLTESDENRQEGREVTFLALAQRHLGIRDKVRDAESTGNCILPSLEDYSDEDRAQLMEEQREYFEELIAQSGTELTWDEMLGRITKVSEQDSGTESVTNLLSELVADSAFDDDELNDFLAVYTNVWNLLH
jgi:hypothetical protein